MTRKDAISLVKQYASPVVLELVGCEESAEKIWDLAQRIDNPEHSENKCMRWLGFVQGVLFAEYVFSVDQLKEHSRTREVK